MIETAPAYVGANFFLKIISANIMNPFKINAFVSNIPLVKKSGISTAILKIFIMVKTLMQILFSAVPTWIQ